MEDSKSKQSCRSVNRRTFFTLLVRAAAAIAGIISLDFIVPRNVAASIVTKSSGVSMVSPETSLASVVIVKGTTDTDAQVYVDKALEALGGVEKLVPTGTNILIKPNVGFYDKDATTDPRITAAVVKALKRAQPNQIIVGESALRGIDVEHALQVTGTRSLAEAAGAEVRDLRKDDIVTVEIPNGVAIKSVTVFKTVRDSFIVSVPRLKRHSATTATISLKNMIGTLSDNEKGRFHQVNLNQCIADLSLALHPGLVVIDATRAMTKRGPSGGVMVDLNLVVASTDPVAADLIAAEELFKAEGTTDPRGAAISINHIQNAAQLGVGIADFSKIQVLTLNIG